MDLYKSASLQSSFRGYDYFKNKKVISYEKISKVEYKGIVKGSDNNYDVFINIEHPKKNSSCNCPHAEGTKITCKHMVALYFTIFPKKAKQFMDEIDEHNRKVEEYYDTLDERVQAYIKQMNKSELQQELLDCLYQEDWLYERFAREHID